MHRFDITEDQLIFELIDRSHGDSYSLPEEHKIGFQRFGLQLREEDFEPEGSIYSGFKVRDRSELRKSNSGKSVMTNTEGEFKVELDVWPFEKDELAVMFNPGKYLAIKGAHDERQEDGSDCTRKFHRFYILPRGCTGSPGSCTYRKWILTIRVNKFGVSTKEPAIIPITRASSEGRHSSGTPSEIEEVSVTDEEREVSVPTEVESTKDVITDEDREEASVPTEVESTKEEIVIGEDSTSIDVTLARIEAELARPGLDDLVRKNLEFTKKYLSGAVVSKVDDEADLKDLESSKETTIADNNADVKKTVSDVIEDVKRTGDDKVLPANRK